MLFRSQYTLVNSGVLNLLPLTPQYTLFFKLSKEVTFLPNLVVPSSSSTISSSVTYTKSFPSLVYILTKFPLGEEF